MGRLRLGHLGEVRCRQAIERDRCACRRDLKPILLPANRHGESDLAGTLRAANDVCQAMEGRADVEAAVGGHLDRPHAVDDLDVEIRPDDEDVGAFDADANMGEDGDLALLLHDPAHNGERGLEIGVSERDGRTGGVRPDGRDGGHDGLLDVRTIAG